VNTRMITVNPLNPEAGPIDEAVYVLKRGGVIGYPTETVYGLAVDAYNEDALRKLFMIKEREMNKPISLLVRDVAMVEAVASRIPPVALSLIRGYWPGALTIIFAASERCSPILTGQSGKIGVRISPHRIVQTLLDAFKNPITATSANLSGMPSVVDSHEVYRVFRGKIDLVIDGGTAPGEGESTVIDVTVSPPKVLREGVVKFGGVDRGGG
jgi:L-threonylcarbamoyladenylate synthase